MKHNYCRTLSSKTFNRLKRIQKILEIFNTLGVQRRQEKRKKKNVAQFQHQCVKKTLSILALMRRAIIQSYHGCGMAGLYKDGG